MLPVWKWGRSPATSPVVALAFLLVTVSALLFSADAYSTNVTILTTALPYAVEGLEYEEGLIQCMGGEPPYSWTISSGALPSWASGPEAVQGETGYAYIRGTPASGEAGSATFTVQVTDSVGQSTSRELTLVVSPDYPYDYWTYFDLPDLTDEDRQAFIDKTPEEWDSYYATANQDAHDISAALEAYILEWYYGDADPTIPVGILPTSINNAKTLRWTLLRPEEVQPEDQWYIFPSFAIPQDYANLPSHSSDPHATYLKLIFIAPFGSELLLEGDFPYSRFMDYQIIQPFDPEYPATGNMGAPEVPIVDVDIEPDPGHVNPFRAGADRGAPNRHYHLVFELAAGNAADLNPGLMQGPHYRSAGNTRVGGPLTSMGAFGSGGVGPSVLWVRYFAPDDEADPYAGVGLPTALMRLSTGETFWIKPDFSLAEERQSQTWSVTPRMPMEPFEQLGSTLGWFKVFGLTLIRGEVQSYGESLPWGEADPVEKKESTRLADAGFFKRGPEFESPGNLEASATTCNYTSYLTRPIQIEPGHVLVVTGKLPTTPDTRNGLQSMTPAQARYWSISRYVPWHTITTGAEEETGEGLCLSSLMDDEVLVDGENKYIVVYSLPEERPSNAVEDNGVTWQSFGPTNFGFITVRWLSVWPDHFLEEYSPHAHNIPWKLGAWSQPTYDSSLVGTNVPGVMGPYHPVLHYMTREDFEAMGASLDPDGFPAWQPESRPPVVDRVVADGAELSAPYLVAVRELDSIAVEVEASDPDDDNLSYEAYFEGVKAEQNPAYAFSFDPGARRFTWNIPPGSPRVEPYELIFVVSDGLQSKTATVRIAVDAVDAPAVDWIRANGVDLSDPYAASLEELETIVIEIQASDPDDDPLTYRAWLDGLQMPAPGEDPDASFSFDPATRLFQWTPPLTTGRTDPYVLTFGVEDGIFTTLATVQITVDPLHPPSVDWIRADGVELTKPYEASLEELETIEVQIQASDLDGDPLVYSAWMEGLAVPTPGEDPDSSFTFDPATRLFRWTPPFTSSRPDPYELTFGVEDGVFTTLVAVQITVTPLRPPVIEWVRANGVALQEPYHVVIRERETLQVQFAATSPWGGDPVLDARFNGKDVPSPGEVAYPPEYYSFDPETGLFSLIPLPGTAGDVPSSLNLLAITSPVWSYALVKVHVRPQEADFECPECIPLAGGGAYGKVLGGDQTHPDQVKYSFEGLAGDVTVAYEVWDVDDAAEVEILANGVPVGCANPTPNETWSGTRLVVLPDALIFDAGTNILTFRNTYNPPAEEWWGVRDVSMWDGCPECIPLPDSREYGNISGGDQTHIDQVNYSFEGIPGDVTIAYKVYDVDFSDEVEILVNGIHVTYAEITLNASWSELRSIVLPDVCVLDGQVNVLTFRNTYNPPKTYWWGVGNASILREAECPDCIPLPDYGDYGRISGGDQAHADEVDFSFEGMPGEVTIVYEVWDVDFSNEVEIRLNGVPLAYASVTADNAWSDLKSIVLPDCLVFDSGTNVLTFNSTYNPPKTYWWGVGNVSILREEECPDCIPLPDYGEYGRISGGDQSHVEEVNFSFESIPGEVTIVYEVWDVDFSNEVEIRLNGVPLAYASVTADNAWSDLKSIVLPDCLVFDSGTNVLTFNSTYNPPKTYWWGVGNVSILREEECPDCIPLPDYGEYGRISGGDQSHVEEVNFSFESIPGDVTIVYEVWDVDFDNEVEIRLNGVPLAYASVTADNAWSDLKSIVLPDCLVFDSGTNVLTFNNTYNPPKTYWWGVGNVSIE